MLHIIFTVELGLYAFVGDKKSYDLSADGAMHASDCKIYCCA